MNYKTYHTQNAGNELQRELDKRGDKNSFAFNRTCKTCNKSKPISGGSLKGGRFMCKSCLQSQTLIFVDFMKGVANE